MCGIFVKIKTNSTPISYQDLSEIDILRHRGMDDEGKYIHESVGFAHKRLSIYDVSKAGAQPMHSNGFTIVFNGAVYNFKELRNLLQLAGFSFTSHSDTEVVLKAFMHWGNDCFDKFIGQWAMVILNENTNKITACRDRFGIKPLYICRHHESICMASELKCFEHKEINIDAVDKYLLGEIDDADATLFYKNISELPPGNIFEYDLINHTEKTHSYYLPKHSEHNYHINFQQAVDQFKNLLIDSISLCNTADVPIGLSLSGGMDSNSILACMSSDHTIPCYSINFSGKYDESKYINASKKINRAVHFIEADFKNFIDVIDAVSHSQDLPFGSMSIIAQYLVFQRIAEDGIKVILSGQGADEVLCGYNSFIKAYYQHLALTDKFKSISYLSKSAIAFPSLFYEKTKANKNGKTSLALAKENIYDYQLKTIMKNPLPSLLRYEDRNSMAHGIESRLPFLDHRIVDFCLSLPIDFLIQAGQRKPLLKAAMVDLIPEVILERKDKFAYAVPQEDWMKNQYKLLHDLTLQAEKKIQTIGLKNKYHKTWLKISVGTWLEHQNTI
jgi:asparagine synthase (glutamine-hydrolysing)